MNVGFSLLTLFPGRVGGSESYVRGLLRQYAAGNGPERVQLLANRHVEEAYEELATGPVELRPVRSYRPGDSQLTRLAAMLAAGVAPRRAARDVPGDLDVVHYPVTVPIPATRRPTVVTLFDVQHHDLPSLFSRAERTYRRRAYDGAARAATVVVTTSEHSAQRMAELAGVPRERIEVVHMGIDLDRYTPEGDSDDELMAEHDVPAEYVVYPANLWPHKNHERLLEALAAAKTPGLSLVLTGQTYGRLDALLQRARRLGIEERVHHLGFLPAPAVPALYRRARAMVFPSRYEGFGSPPLEAMACGCPVAASRGGSLPEVCGDAALSFDADDTEAIAAAIERVTGDEAMRKRLRTAGMRQAQRFDWARAARRHVEIYERAAATSGPVGGLS
ncbi:MAG: glycosyltransferase family 1 protein [Thermoleophilaceae bacterium]